MVFVLVNSLKRKLVSVDGDTTSLPVASQNEDDPRPNPKPKRARGPVRTSHKSAAMGFSLEGQRSKIFPLLRLPPEIRNTIYELALSVPEGTRITIKQRNGQMQARRYVRDFDNRGECLRARRLALGLLCVNTQIYKESIGYLYDQTIEFKDFSTLDVFLQVEPGRRAKHLLHVKVNGTAGLQSLFRPWISLANATSLRSLEFNYALYPGSLLYAYTAWTRSGNPVNIAQAVFRRLRPWLSSYGSLERRKDAGVDIFQFSQWKTSGAQWRFRSMDNAADQAIFIAELRRLANKVIQI